MAYCTQQDIINLIGEETLIEATADSNGTQIDSAKVSAAIASADAEINTYFVSCATIPMQPVPDIVTALSARLASHALLMKNNVTAVKIEGIASWRADAIETLKRLEGRCDKLTPVPGITGTPEAQRKSSLRVLTNEAKFTPAVLKTML